MNETVLKPITSRRKVESAQAALTELALQAGANGKLPTVREICKSLGISAVTAGHVLAGLEEQGVIVRRQGSGIYASPRLYQKSIGLVFGANPFEPGSSPFNSLLVEACQKRAQSHDENFSYYLDLRQATDEQHVHADLADALAKKRLDGILLAARHSVSQEAWLREQGVPVVSFAGGVAAPYLPGTVGFDLKELARHAVRALADRGCRRIGLVSAWKADAAGFIAAMGELGLLCETWQMVHTESPSVGESRKKSGARAMEQLLEAGAANKRCDGVVVTDDMLTVGVISALQDRQLAVGRDVVIASHANKGAPTLEPYESCLIRIEVDPNEIVEMMFQMLERAINGKVIKPAGAAVHLQVREPSGRL